ncbi:HCL240Cp [Eremothecium sinecaudum]|uniref:HCL240Cp n=1 Tax=Eremothecium sinecaudum TaxID=45286 RepID=A0A0X8HR48_9SACH|nr:HCL240Cp [Eremothecium sinecaudum]AMD19911.1 HCL240Cp [Eremothecium sinecaudum]
MDMIQGFIQPQKTHSVEDAIPTFCDRVESSTLISDRRSAVLSLKSFSREYRETVIASGLKPLISALKKDHEDEDSVKAILETLLILFIRGEGSNDLTRQWISQHSRLKNGKYPSPLVMKQELEQFDQFSLWIADALTQTNELVHLFIRLLENDNFHIRLYTIQLLEAIITTRPQRGREALISLPIGISTLVSMLDDIHDPIRDEAILLLTAVSSDNSHIQKLVAFENIFQRLFMIVENEGGLRGSIVVGDCLTLISTILKYNTSNQCLFFESSNLPYLARVLNEPISGDEEFYWNSQRLVNIGISLEIVRLTVEPGNSTTKKHQIALSEAGILMVILRLALYHGTPNDIRPLSLLTAADLIRDNPTVQKQLGDIDVPYWDICLPNATIAADGAVIPILDLLMSWVFYSNSVLAFEIRVASLELLKAYFSKNLELRRTVLQAQIENLKDDSTENRNLKPNFISILIEYDPHMSLNPYKLFFATDLLLSMAKTDEDSVELAEMLRNLICGDSATDAEGLSFIQTIFELLLTSITSKDIRIPLSYLGFLVVYMFEDLKAVEDFLSSKANINSLLNYASHSSDEVITVKCMIIMLLGVAYEFSSSTAAVPRAQLYDMLVKTIGVDNYTSKIKQFKDNIIKDFGSSYFGPEFDDTGLPKIYYTTYFVHLFKENYFRIQSSLRRSPEEDPNGKISFKDFIELQEQLIAAKKQLKVSDDENSKIVQELKTKIEELEQELEKIKLEHIKSSEGLSISDVKCQELTKSLKASEQAVKDLTAKNLELEQLKDKNQKQIEGNKAALAKFRERVTNLEENIKVITDEKKKAEDGINKMNRELFTLTKEKDSIANELKKLQKQSETSLQNADKENKLLNKKISQLQSELNNLQKQIEVLISEKNKLNESNLGLSKQLEELKPRIASHEKLIPKLTDKLKSLATDYKEIDADRETLRKQLEDMQVNSNSEVSALKSEVNNFEKANSALQKANEELTGRVAELTESLNSTKKKLKNSDETLKAEKKSLLDNIIELKSQFSSAKKESEELKKSLATSSKEFERVSQKVKDLEKSRDEFASKLKSTQLDLESANSNGKNLENERDQYKSELGVVKDSNLNLEKKCENLESDLKSKIKELDNSNSIGNNISVDKDREHNHLIEQLNDLKDEKDSMKLKTSQLEKELKERTENAKKADLSRKIELATANNSITEYQKKLSELQDKHSALEKKYSEVGDANNTVGYSNDNSGGNKKNKRNSVKKENQSDEQLKILTKKVTALESENKSLNVLVDELKAVKEKLSEKDAQITKLNNELTEKGSRSEITIRDMDAKIQELTIKCESVEELKKSFEELQKQNKVVESERDELVLLVSELDEKNQHFRDKLEGFDYQFSSEEEEDEDNDGDDGGDENDDNDP